MSEHTAASGPAVNTGGSRKRSKSIPPSHVIPSLHDSFRTFVENTPDIVMRFDRQYRHIYVNPSLMKASGRPAGDFLGKTNREAGHPEGFCSLMDQRFRQVVAGKAPVVFDLEYPGGGERQWYQNTLFPELDTRGEVTSFICVSQNVTERKRMEQELRESEKRFRAVIENSIDAAYRRDLRTDRYDYMSPVIENLTGYTAEEFNGLSLATVLERMHPDDIAGVQEALGQVMSDKATQASGLAEYRLKGKDGKYRWLGDSFTVIRDRKGMPRYRVGIVRDISERKRAEDVLKRDKEALQRLVYDGARDLLKANVEVERTRRLSDIGVLASTIAHEMRNPLAAIKVAAYNIERKAGTDDRFTRQLLTINNKVRESDLIIQNLLSYSRVKEPVLEQVPLAPILNECMEAILSKYAAWHVELNKKILFRDSDLITADPTQLKILFTNILDNAFQAHADKTGAVSVRGKKDHDYFTVEIRDRGAGIDREDMKRIFEPFFTRKSRGTGLGLTISKQIVDLHNGRISIAAARGGGTSVKVALPVKKG